MYFSGGSKRSLIWISCSDIAGHHCAELVHRKFTNGDRIQDVASWEELCVICCNPSCTTTCPIQIFKLDDIYECDCTASAFEVAPDEAARQVSIGIRIKNEVVLRGARSSAVLARARGQDLLCCIQAKLIADETTQILRSLLGLKQANFKLERVIADCSNLLANDLL